MNLKQNGEITLFKNNSLLGRISLLVNTISIVSRLFWNKSSTLHMQRRSLSFRTMIEQAKLYFIPKKREFLKIQPGTGDNLSPEDIAEGYTDYVIWNRFRPEYLDIDGVLDMECLDSGMVLLMAPIAALQGDVLEAVLEQAYGDRSLDTVFLLGD